MKNLILFILIISILSCQPYINQQWDDLPGLIGVWDNIKTLSDIENWIHANIKYKKDSNNIWQYPSETLCNSSGDCEDKALLFCAMANKLLNKKPMLVLYMYDVGHMEAVYNNTEYFWVEGDHYLLYIWNYAEIANEIERHRF